MEVYLDYALDAGNPSLGTVGMGVSLRHRIKIQGVDGIATSDQLEKSHKQGDGQPPKPRSLQPGISRLSTAGELCDRIGL